MESVKQNDFKVLDLGTENIFIFSDGLPAFEKIKRFCILTDPEEAPFGRLTAVDFDVCFVVISPWIVNDEYKADIDDEDIKKIGDPSPDELLILSIANIPEGNPQDAMLNLVAPIIINTKKGLGRQVIINNHQEYTAKFPLWKGR